MAADRARIAAALAREEQRRRLMESVPSTERVAPAPQSRNLRRDLENLSIGVGEGITNQLEGLKGIVTDPIGSAKAGYETVKGVVRDPSVLADALRYTAQKAGSGPLGAGEVIGEMVSPMRGKPPVMQEIDVYHGSPHRFEEFDASKIGTGEGAQAYGHGIYLAENPEIARDYQVRLSYDPEKMKIGGKQINAVYNQLQNAAARMPPARAAAEYEKLDLIERLMLNNPVDEVEKAAAELSPATQKWFATQVKPSFETYGSFYKADLPDEMVDRMLDWDKPLSEQPKVVQQALAKLDPDSYSPQGMDYSPEEPGQMIYMRIANSPLAKNQAEAAAALKAAGIPGLRYLDAGSRGQGGSGTRNFVVFPGEEKKVSILERDGKKLASALKATAAQKQDVEVNLYPVRNQPNVLYLSKIEVPQGQRGQGIGSSVMQDIINQADADGKTITLTPSTAYGATSTKRLKDFYKRFGFVENSGRNKNYALNETMYRLPKKPKE
jgi:predicted GNAT family acetyltransferase